MKIAFPTHLLAAQVFIFGLVCSLVAQDPASETQRKEAQKQKNAPLEPEFGELAKSQSMVGSHVHKKDHKPFGIVKDLILDLETGHVVFVQVLVVQNRASPASAEFS